MKPILIVDDEPSITALIRRVLTTAGYTCQTVNDGAAQGNIENRAKKQEKEDVNEKAYGIPEDSRGLDVRRDFGSVHDQETTIAL